MIESSDWVNAVLKHRQPLEPLETDVVAELQSLPAVRAVVFDIYGTLVISGSGDVGSADTTRRRLEDQRGDGSGWNRCSSGSNSYRGGISRADQTIE